MAVYVVKLGSLKYPYHFQDADHICFQLMLSGIIPTKEYADTAAELVKLRREAKLNGNFFVEPEVEGLWGLGGWYPVPRVWQMIGKG